MEQAIIGLVGVVVGGLVAGGATYVMARRGDRQRRLGAARLVEAELRKAAMLAQSVLPFLLEDYSAQPAMRGIVKDMRTQLARLPSPLAWDAHKGELAQLLPGSEWYALVRSYEANDILRHIDWQEITTSDGRLFHSYVHAALSELLEDLRRGAAASAAMTGTTETQRPPSSFLRTYLLAKASAPASRSALTAEDATSDDR